jgi:hypothetical protein
LALDDEEQALSLLLIGLLFLLDIALEVYVIIISLVESVMLVSLLKDVVIHEK